MASAGSIYFDAKLDTKILKNQIKQLSNSILTINIKPKISKGDIQKQLNNITKNGSYHIKVNVDAGKIKNQLNNISKNNSFFIKANIKLDAQSIQKQLDSYFKNNGININQNNNSSVNKAIANYKTFERQLARTKRTINSLRDSYKSLNLANTSANINKKIRYIDKEIAKNKELIKTSKAVLNADKDRNNLTNKQSEAIKKQINETSKLNKQLQQTKANMLMQSKNMAKKEQSATNLANGFGGVSSIIGNLGSGNGIIHTLTSIGQIGGRALATAIGTGLSGGNPIIGQAAGQIVSSIIGILGSLVNLVANIVKTIISVSVKLIKTGIAVIKNLIKSIVDTIRDLPSTIKKIVSKLGNISFSFKMIAASINYAKNVLNQFIGIISQKFSAYGILSFIQDCLEMGSSLTEQYHILKVVTPSFTEYNNALAQSSQYSEYMSTVTEKLGISTVNATKYIAGYASMWKSLGVSSSDSITEMSKSMLQLTSDISSFKDLDYADVYKSLKSVIFGGQTRTGLNLGVDIYVESMKKYAESVGKTWDNLDGAGKAALRLQKIMGDLKFMYGDFAKTSYTWANQQRLLKEQLVNLKSIIGENLIMVFNVWLILLNKCISALATLSSAINGFLKAIGLGKVLQSAGGSISSALDDETEAFNNAADNVGSAGSSAAKKITRSLLGFDKLLNNLSDDSDSGSSSGGGGGSSSAGSLIGIDNSKEEVKKVNNLVTKSIDNLKKSLKKVTKFFKTLWNDFKTYFANPFAEFLQGENGIPRLINNIAKLIDSIDWKKLNKVFKDWFKSLEPLAEFFVNVGLDIQEYFINPLITFFMNNILQGIITTLTKFNNAVDWDKVRKGIQTVLKALEPLLKTIMSAGLWIFENILEPIGEWFFNSVWPKLSKVIANTFSTLQTLFIALKPYWDEFFNDFLKPFGELIGSLFLKKLDSINKWLENLKKNLQDETWVKNNFGFLSDDIEQLKEDLANFDISAIIKDLFNVAIDIIKNADEKFNISENIKTMLSHVIDYVKKEIAPYVIRGLKSLWNDYIVPSLPGLFEKAKNIIWNIVQPIIELAFTKMYEFIWKFWWDILTLQFFAKLAKAISTAIVKAIGGLFGINSKEEKKTKGLGETIVTSMINGFVNFIKSDSIIQTIVKAIKGAFDKAVKLVNFVLPDISFNKNKTSSNPNDSSPIWSTKSIATNIPAFANGGYVHHSPGGSLVRVAEAGEDEHIFGDRKLRQVIQEELGNNNSQVPIVLQIDGNTLGTWMIDYIKGEAKRTGKTII